MSLREKYIIWICINAYMNLTFMYKLKNEQTIGLEVTVLSLIYTCIYQDDTGNLNVSSEDRFMVTDRF